MSPGNPASYVDDRPDDAVFSVNSEVFTDQELFDLELKFIFEKSWAFLGFESQMAQLHDYISTAIGRVPVLVMRDAQGMLGGFLNMCRHKGTVLCREESGNRKRITCPYHGWAYDSGGTIIHIKDRNAGLYGEAFQSANHNLVPLGRIESYKGLIFGSLNTQVPPLSEFLGELRFFLDLALEQGAHGIECLPGRIQYTFDANWKMQLDNGLDSYHLTSTHTSFMQVVRRRDDLQTGNVDARQFDWNKRREQQGGAYAFEYGHSLVWFDQPEPHKRPLFASMDEVRQRVGEQTAHWMLKLRNMTVFPNLQIADSSSLILRTFRPLAVDKTEMRIYCLAPIGEPAGVRAWRLRQFEDFFNVTGLATPDDTTLYEDAQAGFAARRGTWLQGHERGITALSSGPDARARELGVNPLTSLSCRFDVQPETVFQPVYREWARLMQAGISGEQAYRV